jgi:hypothetical protein
MKTTARRGRCSESERAAVQVGVRGTILPPSLESDGSSQLITHDPETPATRDGDENEWE